MRYSLDMIAGAGGENGDAKIFFIDGNCYFVVFYKG